MTSIGKFIVAGAAASQESTLALANINFDFSLVKLEAPLEYRGLGITLSKKRKTEAEEGSTHITARKLGALFVDDLPNTPKLARTYGLRVSEIAENPRFNPKGTVSDGPFAEHVGADELQSGLRLPLGEEQWQCTYWLVSLRASGRDPKRFQLGVKS